MSPQVAAGVLPAQQQRLAWLLATTQIAWAAIGIHRKRCACWVAQPVQPEQESPD
jgi:hypothetical protein